MASPRALRSETITALRGQISSPDAEWQDRSFPAAARLAIAHNIAGCRFVAAVAAIAEDSVSGRSPSESTKRLQKAASSITTLLNQLVGPHPGAVDPADPLWNKAGRSAANPRGGTDIAYTWAGLDLEGVGPAALATEAACGGGGGGGFGLRDVAPILGLNCAHAVLAAAEVRADTGGDNSARAM